MRRLVLPLLLIALLCAACGASSSLTPAGGGDVAMPPEAVGDGGMPADRDLAGEDGGFAGEPGTPSGQPNDAGSKRQIIRTGSLSIEVDDANAAVEQVRDLLDDFDGYLADAQVNSRAGSAQLTLRVPVERFDAAVAALRSIGEPLSFSSSEDDVSTELIDLEARLENLRAAEANYRELIAQAANVEETLMVQARLDEVRGQIESLDGQRAYLQRQADMATLTVMLSEPVEPVTAQGEDFDPGQVMGEALAGLLGIGQAALVVGIYALIVGLPLALVAGLIGLPLWLLRRRRSQRATPQN